MVNEYRGKPPSTEEKGVWYLNEYTRLLVVMPPSWARLGSARIQLELEAFQLGSCDFWDSSFCENLAKSSYL